VAHEGRYGVSGCDKMPCGCVSVGCGRPHHTTARCEAAGNHPPRHTRSPPPHWGAVAPLCQPLCAVLMSTTP
jgi:hypothetical protein